MLVDFGGIYDGGRQCLSFGELLGSRNPVRSAANIRDGGLGCILGKEGGGN